MRAAATQSVLQLLSAGSAAPRLTLQPQPSLDSFHCQVATVGTPQKPWCLRDGRADSEMQTMETDSLHLTWQALEMQQGHVRLSLQQPAPPGLCSMSDLASYKGLGPETMLVAADPDTQA